LIAAVLLSLLAAFTAKRKNQPSGEVLNPEGLAEPVEDPSEDESMIFAVVAQFGATSAFIFMVLGLYVQLSGEAMSFAQLLPSALIVAMIFVASILVVRTRTKAELGMKVLGFGLGTVLFGFFLAFLLSFFPKLIAFQWHLLKRL
jgi:magnesium-transporting ATPase (P-type)